MIEIIHYFPKQLSAPLRCRAIFCEKVFKTKQKDLKIIKFCGRWESNQDPVILRICMNDRSNIDLFETHLVLWLINIVSSKLLEYTAPTLKVCMYPYYKTLKFTHFKDYKRDRAKLTLLKISNLKCKVCATKLASINSLQTYWRLVELLLSTK